MKLDTKDFQWAWTLKDEVSGGAGLSVSEGSYKPPQAFTDTVCKEDSKPSTYWHVRSTIPKHEGYDDTNMYE